MRWVVEYLIKGAFSAFVLTSGITPARGDVPMPSGIEPLAMLAPQHGVQGLPNPRSSIVNPIEKIERALASGLLQAEVNADAFWNQPRVLSVYRHGLRKEIKVTFWKDGKYIRSALKQLNRLSMDLHNGAVKRMDKRVFDSLWVAQQIAAKFGFTQAIEITSGYRSPATNEALRKDGFKAAKKSLHMLGKAIDFRIPNLPNHLLGSLMQAFELGGVGTYHREEGGWVHIDTGRPRAWKG